LFLQSKPAWGVLAGLSAWKQELLLAEMSYAALGMFEKVVFIKEIKVKIHPSYILLILWIMIG